MKKLIIIAVLLAGVLAAGCNGVTLNAEYSQLLDYTAALSDETARRAAAGKLSQAEMTAALAKQAATWRMFQDTRDGREGRQ